MGADFTHAAAMLKHRRAVTIQYFLRSIHIIRADAVVLFNQGNLAWVNGGFADQSVQQILFDLGAQEFGDVQVLKHRSGEMKAMRSQSGDQTGDDAAQRRAVNADVARAAAWVPW